MTTDSLFIDHLETPLGKVEITATEQGIRSINFVDKVQQTASNDITELAKQQLDQYFRGDLTHFNLPLAPQGTQFQHRVWRALSNIKFGETCSYADIANSINNPKAVRAVGAANGKNPLAIVVPCHRVIGSNGALTGYASGVERKAWLLRHEGAQGFESLNLQ